VTERSKLVTRGQFLKSWYDAARHGRPDIHVRLTIYTRKYDRVTRTLQLKGTIPHVWCEVLEVIVVPVNPIIDREAYVTFWIIANKIQAIFSRKWAFHQADGFSVR
jgi:hypothetical protein